MAKPTTRTITIPRDARTGRIVSLQETIRRPSTTTVEVRQVPIRKVK